METTSKPLYEGAYPDSEPAIILVIKSTGKSSPARVY
jgi:hypothetical protein